MTEYKIPTETFDVMQHYYRTVHDPLIHCAVYLDGHADRDALLEAADALIEQLPVLGCRFDESGLRWVPGNITAEDFVFAVKGDSEDTVNRCLTKSIAIAKEPQLKVFVVRYADHDVLCLLINHMVCDGAGFKQCICRLAELYVQCRENRCRKEPAVRDRSMKPLFSGMNFTEKLSLLFLKRERESKIEVRSPELTGDRQNSFIVTRKLSKEDFSVVKEAAKSHGATVNDMILSAYIRALHGETGQAEIEIPCPVDLRKYCRGSLAPGLCNLTGNYSCRVSVGENESFADTLVKVSRRMQRQKESRYCLKGPFQLSILSHLLSKKQMRKLLPKLFTVPVVGYTNLGILDFQKELNGHITDCFMTGAVKYVPYFQIAVSTFDGVCTLSCNMHGTPQDKRKIEGFLEAVAYELKNGGT